MDHITSHTHHASTTKKSCSIQHGNEDDVLLEEEAMDVGNSGRKFTVTDRYGDMQYNRGMDANDRELLKLAAKESLSEAVETILDLRS